MPVQPTLPYNMGNAGDLLKHGVLAELLLNRQKFSPDQSIRFLDLFGGQPISRNTPKEIIRRVEKLSDCALKDGQTEISFGNYHGSGMLVQTLGTKLGIQVSVFTSDRNEYRRVALHKAGLPPLQNEFPELGDPAGYDAYKTLEVIQEKVFGNDVILLDPFADFLKPSGGRGSENRAESVLPIIGKISESSTVLLFVLNLNPFNRYGRRFDELLAKYLNCAYMMTCPPINSSNVAGKCKYYADLVLAGPGLDSDSNAAINFRERLEFLAQKLADALGLSGRGRTLLRPRSI